MGPLWHIIALLSIAYISWRAVALYPPQVNEQRRAKYHYVRAAMLCALLQLVLMFVLYSGKVPIGSLLPIACFATWTATAALILLYHRVPKLVRHPAILVVIGTPLILLLYPGSAPQFLADADRFSAAIAHRVTTTKTSNIEQIDGVMKSTPGVKLPSEASSGERQPNATDNPTTFSQFRASHLLRAIFFFIHAFLVMHYFGTMWYFAYEERTKLALKAAMEQDAADQIVLFLSIALSLWLAFVLLGFDTLSVSIFSGFVVIGVSFILKDLLVNFISGALLLWLKSVRIGDVISINKSATVGRVVGMTMRYLIVEDRNDIEYLIPYSQLANATIENWSKGKKQVRLKLGLSVAYGTPIEKVKDIVTSVCFEVSRVLNSPLPVLLVVDMGESAIQFQLRFRIADPENGISNVKSELYEKLLKRFEDAQIEIPYPQREIRIRTAPSDKSSPALVA